jgi:hypothetical protein
MLPIKRNDLLHRRCIGAASLDEVVSLGRNHPEMDSERDLATLPIKDQR